MPLFDAKSFRYQVECWGRCLFPVRRDTGIPRFKR